MEGNTVLCYCTQDAKWRPGGGGGRGGGEERVIVSLKVNFKGNTVVPWIILPLESSWVWWTFTTNIFTIDHILYLSSFRKIKTKNKNPTYLAIFFTSIIWEPEIFFCMALWYGAGVCLSVRLSVHKACKHDTDWTVAARTVKLGTHTTYDKRTNPIDFQGRRSKVKVTSYTLLLNLVNTIQTESFKLELSN